MRGLDPRIHLVREMMDCRLKPGNDERRDYFGGNTTPVWLVMRP
jgi:hypothetical protein